MNILENSKFVFMFFIALGFIAPVFAEHIRPLLIPMLVIMMVFSVKDVHFGHITKGNYSRMLKLIFVNFLILSPLYILLALLFIKNLDYQKGFILLAAVPPAAAIIPLAYIYHGDVKDSVLGEIVCYVFSFLFSPLLVYLFLGESVDIYYFIKLLFLIIILPILIARLIHNLKWKVFEKKNMIINIIYGISIYIFIGLNHKVFIEGYRSLIPVAVIIIITTFILGFLIFTVLRHKKVKRSHDIIYVLFGTLKNGNTAATLAILFFGPSAAIPAAVRGFLLPFYMVFLEYLFRKHRKIIKG